MYMTLEGIFGTPIDVSSSLIILFTIFGAVLQFSNAGQFFIDFSLAAFGRKATGAGRAVTAASFLLGGPSGSGVATTVTLGTVAYPMLAKAGYEKNAAGGLLAAGGLGAILSPPVLGAAAFLISEFLKISYLEVIKMAVIPTCLYYLSLLFMVEIDARKHAMVQVRVETSATVWQLTKTMGFHFISLVAIVVFLLLGFSPIASVFWATVVAALISFLNRDSALLDLSLFVRRPPGWVREILRHSKLMQALEAGSVGMLSVAATCAAAGIIVGVVTLTGLGLALFRHHHFVCGRQPGSDRDLHRIDRLGRRPRGTGDRKLHHLCGGRRSGADQARRARLRRAHVHLLLRSVVRSVAADRAISLCRCRDHRRRSVQDNAAVVEVHAARIRCAVRVRARSDRRRSAARAATGGSWWDVAWITALAVIALAALAGAAEGWLFSKTTRDRTGSADDCRPAVHLSARRGWTRSASRCWRG